MNNSPETGKYYQLDLFTQKACDLLVHMPDDQQGREKRFNQLFDVVIARHISENPDHPNHDIPVPPWTGDLRNAVSAYSDGALGPRARDLKKVIASMSPSSLRHMQTRYYEKTPEDVELMLFE